MSKFPFIPLSILSNGASQYLVEIEFGAFEVSLLSTPCLDAPKLPAALRARLQTMPLASSWL